MNQERRHKFQGQKYFHSEPALIPTRKIFNTDILEINPLRSRDSDRESNEKYNLNYKHIGYDCCANCTKYLKVIEKMKIKLAGVTDKHSTTEKHLKQYDELLAIKENRLKTQEATVSGQLEGIEREKQRIYVENLKIEQEKGEICREKEILKVQIRRIDEKCVEIERQNRELQIAMANFEVKRGELKLIQQETRESEQEKKDSLLISREVEIQRLLKEISYDKLPISHSFEGSSSDFQHQKAKLKRKKSDLKHFAEELHEIKAKIEFEQQAQYEEFNNRMEILTETERVLSEEKKKLAEDRDFLKVQLESLKNPIMPEKVSKKNVNSGTQTEGKHQKYQSLTVLTKSSHSKFPESKKLIDSSSQTALSQQVLIEISTQTQENSFDRAEASIETEEFVCERCNMDPKDFRRSVSFKLSKEGDTVDKILKRLPTIDRQSPFYDKSPSPRPKGIERLPQIEENVTSDIDNQDQNFENLHAQLQLLTNKLKIVECSREEYENENYELYESIKSLKLKKKGMKSKLQELENLISMDNNNLKRSYNQLIKEYEQLEAQNKEISDKNILVKKELSILNLKYEDLENTLREVKCSDKLAEEDFIEEPKCEKKSLGDCVSSDIKKIYQELEGKLESVSKKEKELRELQVFLQGERKNIEDAAMYVKHINEDLESERAKLSEDREVNEAQKLKIIEVDKQQKEKGKLLANKERELLMIREDLTERESLLVVKERKLTKNPFF